MKFEQTHPLLCPHLLSCKHPTGVVFTGGDFPVDWVPWWVASTTRSTTSGSSWTAATTTAAARFRPTDPRCYGCGSDCDLREGWGGGGDWNLGKNDDDFDFTVKLYSFVDEKRTCVEGILIQSCLIFLHCDASDCICFIFPFILRSSLKWRLFCWFVGCGMVA